VCAIYLALSRRRREKRIPAVKTVTKDFAEQNRTPSIEPLEKRKRLLLFEREAQRERERTRKRLKNDDLIGFVLCETTNTRKQTNTCGERKSFF
jgi:hypothetical protein